MTLKETLQLAWNNRKDIASAIYNKWVECSDELEQEAQRRKSICESNICGWYDQEGKPETSAIPGKPACSLCHCNISLKIYSMQVDCALKEKLNQTPLWEAVITEEQEKEIAQKKYEEQFKPKQ